MGQVSAHAGRAWWLPVQETDNSGKPLSVISSADSAWNLSYGWTYGGTSGYKKFKGGRNNNLVKVTRIGMDGRPVTLYADKSFDKENAIGFHPRGEDEAIAFAEHAFDRNDPDNQAIFDTEELYGTLEGHIKRLEYTRQILRVTFANGDVCLFFRVPSTVAGELFHLASTGHGTYGRNGIKRHDLGKKFWQSIRIPGHHTGAKYNFEYETHGSSYSKSSGHRYLIKLTAKNIEAVTGNKIPGAKPGDMVQTALSEKELLDIYEREQSASPEERRMGTFVLSNAERNELNAIVKTVKGRQAHMRKALLNVLDIYEIQNMKSYGYEDAYERISKDNSAGLLTDIAAKRIKDKFTRLPDMQSILDTVDKTGLVDEKDMKLLRTGLKKGVLPNLEGLTLADIRNERSLDEYNGGEESKRYNKGHIRYIGDDGKMHYKNVNMLGRVNPINVEPNTALMNKSDAMRTKEIMLHKKEQQVKRGMVGNIWTPAKMRELADSLSDSEAAEFKRNVAIKDYNRALDCLRSMNVLNEYKDENGRLVKQMRKRATNMDTFIDDEE